MPCPDFDLCIVQRSENGSAVNSSAYISASKLYCAYDMESKGYRSKQKELVYETVMLPDHAPPEYGDRENLWNSVEAVETQWNSQLARKLRISLPREVPMDQCVEMVRESSQEQFVSKGMIVDLAIHDPAPPGHNPHAHLLLTMRSLDEQGHWMAKAKKKYVLDENGERIRLPNGRWKSRKVNLNDWNNRGNCETWRHAWETIQNEYLERNGRPERVSLKSYERQGIDRIPMVHMGPSVAHMEAKGIRTNIGDLNRDIQKTNSLMASIRNALQALQSWLASLREKRKILLEELEKLKEPTLAELLSDYYQFRGQEREGWSAKAKLKGTVADYEKLRNAVSYLNSRKLFSLDDLHARVDQLDGRYRSLSSEIRSTQKRINDIVAIQGAYQTMQELQPIHDAWQKKNFKSARDRYRNEHSDELDRYQKAVGLLMKVNGSKTVDHAALRAEYQDLTDDNAARTAELETVKDELKQLRSIRYYISKVVPEEAEPEKVDRLRAVITNVAHPDIRRQMFVLKEKIAEKLDDEEWAELFPQIQRNMAIMIAYDREAFFEKIREYKAEKEAAAFRERMDPDYEFKD
jgi:predicted  nucleic acid-binding Zn-ribbon protein